MKKYDEIIINEEFRMKVINFLNIYGYYKGVLHNIETQKKYVSGELKLSEIICNKKDFKELKLSVKAVLDYCYQNNHYVIEGIMNKFYNVECAEIKKLYGGFFDRF